MADNPQKTYPRTHIVRLTPGKDRKLRALVRRDGTTLMAVWREALDLWLEQRENGHG